MKTREVLEGYGISNEKLLIKAIESGSCLDVSIFTKGGYQGEEKTSTGDTFNGGSPNGLNKS